MTKRRIRLVLSSIVLLTALATGLLIFGYNAVTSTLAMSDYADFGDLPLYQWTRVELSDETQCSDGSEFQMYVRRGESDNLIIHFVGGGACWDATTCSQPITLTNLSGFYFARPLPIFPAVLDGIFQTKQTANPFHDWNAVYIPYCTADFHIGASTPTYTRADNQTFTIHHNGKQNVTETLAWVFDTFENPPKLLISGESAGAFGSVFWTPTIATQYPTSEIYQLADGAYLETPLWNDIVTQVWQSEMLSVVGDDLVGDAYRSYIETSAPNVTYLHINTLYDSVLIYFDSYLNQAVNDTAYAETWSQRMRASMQGLADSDLNYYFYLTDHGQADNKLETPHTSISAPLFYQITEDGVALVDWLRRIVLEDERLSVGEAFLP